MACAIDPYYFAYRWVWTQDELHEPSCRKFPKLEYLQWVFDIWEEVNLLAIPKSRRMMMTWSMIAVHLWICIFKKDKKVFMQSLSEKVHVRELMNKCHYILERLPAFILRQDEYEKFMTHIDFDNNSKCIGIAQGGDKLRMFTATAIYIDEGAIIDYLVEAITGSKPTLEGGGKLTITSSIKPGPMNDIVNDVPLTKNG